MYGQPDKKGSIDSSISGLYSLLTDEKAMNGDVFPGSMETLASDTQRAEVRQGLYRKLHGRGIFTGSYEDFDNYFFNPYSQGNQVAALRNKTFTRDPAKEMARHRALLDASEGKYNPYGTSEVSYRPEVRGLGTNIAPIDLVDREDTLPEPKTPAGGLPKTTRTFGGGVVSGTRGIIGGAQIAVADLLKGFGGNSDDEREAIHLINQMEKDGTLSIERVRGLRERLLKDLDSYTNSDIRFSGDYSKKARQADALKLIEERMQRMGKDLSPEKRAVALDAMRSDLSEKGASEDKANPFVRWKEEAKDYIRKSEVPEGAWAELGSATASVGGALAGQAISMIPGAAPIGQAISLASIGAQTISSGGQAIMDMEDYAAEKGVYITPEEKATIALGYMAAEFGGDALGGAVASKSISAIGKLAGGRIGQKLAVRSLAKGIAGNEGIRQSLSEYAQKPLAIPLAKSAGRQIVRGAVTEGPGESLTTLAQNGALDRVWKDKEDQEAWADVARQAVKDGIYGAWAGALMGGFGAGIQSGQVARMHRKVGLTIVQDEKNNLYEVIGSDKDQSAYLVLDRAGRQKMLPADQVVDAIHYTPEERQRSQKAYDEATEGLHPKEEVLTENQKRAGAILSATEQQQSPIYRATHPEVAEEELNSPVALAGAKKACADVLDGQNEEVKTRVDQMALVLRDGETDPTEELTKLLSDESLSDNDRQSILDVVTAQSRLTAIEQSHQEAMAQMQSELTKEWSAKSVVGDESARGSVISATITDADGKPKEVYVTGGVRVEINENGTAELLPSDDDAPIYVYDESVNGEEKGHIVQMDDLSSPELVAEDYFDVVQALINEAETAFRSEVQAAEEQATEEQAIEEQASQSETGDEDTTTDDFMQSLPRTREGEVDGLKLMSERPDDFIRYLGQLYGEDFVASLPMSKKGALDLKALTPEQTLKINEAALGKSGAVEAARQRRSQVGAERAKLEGEVKNDLGNLEKRMALRKASEEYRLYDDYVRTAEEQARQEREAQKRAEEEALTPEERARREEEKRRKEQEQKDREERIRLENERRRREREELERNAEGSTVREYTEDPPRQARARGARLVNGAVVYRQEPMTVEHYADAERAFSQRPGETRVPVKRTIVEAESLQASHKEGRMNPKHFIPEAQPKDRADNGLSSTAADRIASDIRPDEITGGITAYTGAPVVNGRGEVIQGNNRTDALQTMYDGAERHAKSAERYKEYLKAHASEYGMTAEQVDAMAHPVAVDVAEVSDSEAIRLGHRGQTDLESAGTDTMNAQTVGEELNSDTDPQSGQSMLVSFFNRIFNRTGANGAELSAKMDNMLNRNAEEGLKFLHENGYITDTQYKNAFETNSEGKRVVTAEAKTALKDVALYQLADVIGPRAMDIFYRLPASARNGLATFLYRDSQASFETSLVPDLGDALLVWDSLRQDPDFAGQTNFESAKIFILGKVSLFGRSELETNLGEASSLAKLLAASLQTQTEEQIASVLNQYYDLVGANETGAKTQSLMPTSQPTDTKAGAAEAVYGRVYEVPSGREKHYRFRRDGAEDSRTRRDVAEDFRTRRDALADRITEERRKYAAAMDMSRTFGVPLKLHEDMSTLPEEVRAGFDETHFVKGWFYKGDNAIHIYLPANVDADDVRATFLHEAVGHYGCRELLGEVGYNQVLDNLANKLGEEEVLRAMSEYCNGSQDLTNLGQVRIAMDEWIAHRAESGITKKTVWESIKDFFRKVFGLSGKQIDQSAEMMADDLLRRSAENLQKRAERQQGVATGQTSKQAPEQADVRFWSNRSWSDFVRIRDAAIEQKGLVTPKLNQSSVEVTPLRRHKFTGTGLQAIEKARVWAQGRIVKDYWYHKGKPDGFKYLIDGDGIGKFLSGSSTKNSDNLGLHLAVLKKLPRIIDESILAETHADYKKVDGKRSPENGVGKTTMLVHRLYGAVRMDGKLYRVKTTLHERYDADDRAYDYMVTNVELVISGSSTSDALTNSTRKSRKDIAVAKLLKGVEKSYEPGKLLLDESENTGSEEETTRFRRAERAGDVSGAAEAASDFMRNATPKNTTVDDVLRFLRVYHNSPHLLKKADGTFVDPETGERLGFDHRFIGSGEGFQAHGWGSYFSVNDLAHYASTNDGDTYDGIKITRNDKYVISKGGDTNTSLILFQAIRMGYRTNTAPQAEDTIAKFVEEKLSELSESQERRLAKQKRLLDALKGNEPWAMTAINSRWGEVITDPKTGYEYDTTYSLEEFEQETYERIKEEAKKYRDALEFIERNPDYVKNFTSKAVRHKYQVEIPNPQTHRYLEEGALLTKEEESRIREAAPDTKRIKYHRLNEERLEGRKVWEVYDLLAKVLNGADKASALLNKAGFVGIHYNGRIDGECYVIFNEKDAKITDLIRFRREEAHLAGVHTLTTDNLRHALKMGGLANPSIAVYDTERGLPTRTFGDVALIAPRDLVDAKTGRHKGTYNRDAWTPTYPQVSYELTKNGEDALRSLSDKVRDLGDAASARLLMNEANLSDLSPATLETRLRTNEGVRKLYESEHRGEDYDSYVSSLAKSIEMEDFLFAGQRADGSWNRVPHTLDNVSKLMKRERAEGSKAYPFAYALSKLGSRYRSLSAIRKGEDLLSGKDQAKWEATRKEFANLANELQGEAKSLFDIRGEEHLAALLADGENLFGRPLTVTEEARVSALKEQMKALPTDYFETKVDRPVGLSEFVEAEVPEGTSPELVAELEKSGIKVSTYDSTKEGAMNEAVLSAMDRADATDRGVRFRTGDIRDIQADDYGSKNRIVTKEEYANLIDRLRDTNTPLSDVDFMSIGRQLATFHIEAGSRSFRDFVDAMITDMGDRVRPYLKSFYNGARDLPSLYKYANNMDWYDKVSQTDVTRVAPIAKNAEGETPAVKVTEKAKDTKKAKSPRKNILAAKFERLPQEGNEYVKAFMPLYEKIKLYYHDMDRKGYTEDLDREFSIVHRDAEKGLEWYSNGSDFFVRKYRPESESDNVSIKTKEVESDDLYDISDLVDVAYSTGEVVRSIHNLPIEELYDKLAKGTPYSKPRLNGKPTFLPYGVEVGERLLVEDTEPLPYGATPYDDETHRMKLVTIPGHSLKNMLEVAYSLGAKEVSIDLIDSGEPDMYYRLDFGEWKALGFTHTENPKATQARHLMLTDPQSEAANTDFRFRRAESAGDVSGAAAAASDFIRNATPKNATVDDVLRFLRVYHNSPHLLKKADGSFVDPETGERLGFDHRFMGSGEGAQAHGWGSYFSVKDLEGYGQTDQLIPYDGMPEMTISKDDLSRYTDEQKRWAEMILDLYNDGEGDVGNTFISPLERLYADRSAFDELYDRQKEANTRWDDFVDFYKNRLDEDVRPFHNKYVVEIPNLSDGNYLEEDAPLSEKQASAIKQTMEEKSGSEYDETFYSDFANNYPEWNTLSGGNLYKTLSDYLLKEYTDSPSQAAQWTSEMLNEAGFVGIHYNGRRDGECYVIFNEKDAKITEHIRFRRTERTDPKSMTDPINPQWDGEWYSSEDLTGKSTADLLELPAAPATPEKRPTQSVAEYAETMSRHYADPRVRFRTGAHTGSLRAPQPPRITDGMSLYEVAQLQHEYNRNYRDFSEESMRRMGALDKLPEKFIRSQIDVARPVELFVEEMKRLGLEVSPEENMYWSLMLQSSKELNMKKREVEPMFERYAETIREMNLDGSLEKVPSVSYVYMKDPNVKKSKSVVKDANGYEKASLYLQAKDIDECKKLGLPYRGEKGFEDLVTNKETGKKLSPEEYISLFENAVGKARAEGLCDQIRAISNWSTQKLYEAGLLTEDRYRELTRGSRRYYVPQRGFKITEDTDRRAYELAELKAEGRQSLSADPVANLQAICNTTVIRAIRNRDLLDFYRWCKKNEQELYHRGVLEMGESYYRRTDEVDDKGRRVYLQSKKAPTLEGMRADNQTRREMAKIRMEKAALREKADRGLISSYTFEAKTKELDDRLKAKEDELIVKYRDPNLSLGDTDKTAKKDERVVRVYENGEERIIALSEDYSGKAVADALNNRSIGRYIDSNNIIAKIFRAWGTITRTLSSLRTQYSGAFAVKNTVRDMNAAVAANMGDFGWAYTQHFLRNVPKVQRAVWEYVWKENFGDVEDLKSGYGQYMKEFFEDGAATGYSFLEPFNILHKNLKGIAEPTTWNNIVHGRKGAKNLYATMRLCAVLSEGSELSTRFAEYVTSRERGFSRKEAAIHAKEVTVNFNRHGALSPYLNTLFGFWNASVQGAYRWYRIPLSFMAKVSAQLFITGMLQAYLYLRDDDDKDFTEWDLMTNLCIGNFRYPLPQNLRAFNGAGLQFMLACMGKKDWEAAVIDAAQFMAGEYLPSEAASLLNAVEWDETRGTLKDGGAQVWRDIAPTAISPMADVIANRNFMGQPVYKMPYVRSQDDNVAHWSLGKKRTKQVYKDFAEWQWKMRGGSTERNDLMSRNGTSQLSNSKLNNPSVIEHLVEGYGGGPISGLADIGTWIEFASTGDVKELKKLQMIAPFFRQERDYTATDVKYWELTDLYRSRQQTMSNLRKAKEGEDLERYREMTKRVSELAPRMTAEQLTEKIWEDGTQDEKLYVTWLETKALLKQIDKGAVTKEEVAPTIDRLTEQFRELR